MARPEKLIEWDKVEKRIEAGNSAQQIADEARIDINNFYDRFKKEYGMGFADYARKGFEIGNANLQYVQYAKAISGQITCLQWLAQVRLGQKIPDNIQLLPPNQEDIDKDHIIMMLKDEIEQLKANGNEQKTG